MQVVTTFLDEEAMERLVTGFREHELILEGFNRLDVSRQANKIVWKFETNITSDFKDSSYLEFDGVKTVKLTWINPYAFSPGDTFRVKYTLSWTYRGGGDDPIISRDPFPGATICFQFTAA